MFRPGLRAGQFRAYRRSRFDNARPQYRKFDTAGLLMRWAARPTFYRDVGLLSVGAGGFYMYNLEEVPVRFPTRYMSVGHG
jgi:uncharacterized protein (DUF2461 family)